ncbi:MAG: hypothetical protein ABIA97_02820 [Candidatus Omnitrophota bacterium]
MKQFKDISCFYNTYKDKPIVVLGTGPGLDYWLQDKQYQYKDYSIITINRACRFAAPTFAFFDTPISVHACIENLSSCQNICLPIFSLKEISLNSIIVQEYLERIYFYVWDYKGWGKLTHRMFDYTSANQKLNFWSLFVENGNVQSIAVFCKLLGCSKIIFFGCDGHGVGTDRLYAKVFREENQKLIGRKQIRQQHKYNLSYEGLLKVLKLIGIDYEFSKIPSSYY